jgi:hypothetical protein
MSKLLDAVAPDTSTPAPTATEPPGDEQGWQGTVVDAAKARLIQRWLAADVARLVDWTSWEAGVAGDADQVIAAVRASPQPYLTLMTRPPVYRATVAYAKFCHGLPE